jgi:hypothetical protein
MGGNWSNNRPYATNRVFFAMNRVDINDCFPYI